MNNDAIGVFDSGIGGLTAVKELNKLLPNEKYNIFRRHCPCSLRQQKP